MLLTAMVSMAFAYETDQLTDRERPLADADFFADPLVQRAIERAVADVNERTACLAPPDDTIDRFIELFAQEVSGNARVPGRGLPRGMGYDRVGAALERGPVERIRFRGPDGSVFSGLSFLDSPIIDTAGICSTISLSGVRVGTDKVDHFLATGHAVWERGRRGKNPVAAASWSERSTLGWWTSDAYSYADLAADLAGVAFYDGIGGPDGYVQVADDGCLEVTRPFRWADWVEPSWDEVENPSVYRPAVQDAIDAWLDDHQDEVCAGYAQWADAGYEDRLAQQLATEVPGGIPRVDPFRLVERCSGPEDGVIHLSAR